MSRGAGVGLPSKRGPARAFHGSKGSSSARDPGAGSGSGRSTTGGEAAAGRDGARGGSGSSREEERRRGGREGGASWAGGGGGLDWGCFFLERERRKPGIGKDKEERQGRGIKIMNGASSAGRRCAEDMSLCPCTIYPRVIFN